MSAAHLTTLIDAARGGDAAALGRLYEALYDELHRIARAKLRAGERPTLLDTTGLVHESYLRLVQLGRLDVGSRPHFLAYAARAMRSIVVDAARRRMAERRGGDADHLPLDDVDAPTPDDREIVRVHEALAGLAQVDDRLARVVEMRYFAGLANDEIALALDVSTRTVERDWEKARLYLFSELR